MNMHINSMSFTYQLIYRALTIICVSVNQVSLYTSLSPVIQTFIRKFNLWRNYNHENKGYDNNEHDYDSENGSGRLPGIQA